MDGETVTMVFGPPVDEAFHRGVETGVAQAMTVGELYVLGKRARISVEWPDGEPEGWSEVAFEAATRDR